MLCVLAFGPLRGLRWETHTNNLHVRLDGLAHNMEGDKAPQVDVTLVVRHSISQLTEKDWEACSQTNTGLLHEVCASRPIAAAAHRVPLLGSSACMCSVKCYGSQQLGGC